MDYEFWFWILCAFLAGKYYPRKVYIGSDREKYEAADLGILLGKEDR